MKPETWTPVSESKTAPNPSADYTEASPEEIRADIEKTRAHMDETLARLGRKIHPRFLKNPAVLIAGVTFVLLGTAALIFLKTRRESKRPRTAIWKRATLYDQILIVKALAAAARKGKPAVFVVEPRKL